MAKHLPDIHEEKIAPPLGNTKEHINLGEADNQRRRVHEAKNYRVGNKVDRIAQLDQTKHQLNAARHEGEEQGQADIIRRPRSSQGRDRGCGHQREDGHRPGGQLPGRTPHRANDGRYQGGVEAKLQGQAGQLGIGHGLGHQHQRAGDTGHQVCAQHQGRDRKPGDKGEKTQKEFTGHVGHGAALVESVG